MHEEKQYTEQYKSTEHTKYKAKHTKQESKHKTSNQNLTKSKRYKANNNQTT